MKTIKTIIAIAVFPFVYALNTEELDELYCEAFTSGRTTCNSIFEWFIEEFVNETI